MSSAAPPFSPSWRNALNLRGVAAPNRGPPFRREERSHDAVQQPRPWLWNSGHVHRSAAPSTKPSPTPSLTVALIKLDGVLPDYCNILSCPSYANAIKACAVLDASIATASPVTSRNNSPNLGRTGLRNLAGATPTSPTPGNVMQWLTERRQSPVTSPWQLQSSVSLSAQLLQGEWENYMVPLLLLAGAEVLYAELRHVDATWQSTALLGLYQRISKDLVLVKSILCDPLLGQTTASTHEATAQSLASSLLGLTTICAARAQMIAFQASLFGGDDDNNNNNDNRFDLHQAHETLQLLVDGTLPDVGAAEPIRSAIHRELKTWNSFVKACLALESCRFLNSIMSLYQLRSCVSEQKAIHSGGGTRIQQFLEASYDHLVCLLPIYFDRVDAFAGPLYGFDTENLFAGKSYKYDWESNILEFLKRQDKGGPSMVVAIVLDAVRTNNYHLERGYSWPVENTETDGPLLSPRYSLPAVFIRSTMHVHAAVSRRASTGSNPLGGSGLLLRKNNLSQTGLLPSWNADSPTRSLSGRKQPVKNKSGKWNVMEYAPDTGEAKSWPHSEWTEVVNVLRRAQGPKTGWIATDAPPPSLLSVNQLAPEPEAVTYSANSTDEAAENPSLVTAQTAVTTLFNVDYAAADETPSPAKRSSTIQSTHHVVSLSEYLSMVIIVKGEEESRWHRRKLRPSDEDMRSFLNEMAAVLRVSNRFKTANLPAATKGREALEMSSQGEWNDDQVRVFLRHLKSSFGLRPLATSHESVRSQFATNSQSPRRGAIEWRQLLRRPEPDFPESAAALFLGAELANLPAPSHSIFEL